MVWGGGAPSPLGEGSGEFFLLLALKMVSFGAFGVENDRLDFYRCPMLLGRYRYAQYAEDYIAA